MKLTIIGSLAVCCCCCCCCCLLLRWRVQMYPWDDVCLCLDTIYWCLWACEKQMIFFWGVRRFFVGIIVLMFWFWFVGDLYWPVLYSGYIRPVCVIHFGRSVFLKSPMLTSSSSSSSSSEKDKTGTAFSSHPCDLSFQGLVFQKAGPMVNNYSKACPTHSPITICSFLDEGLFLICIFQSWWDKDTPKV